MYTMYQPAGLRPAVASSSSSSMGSPCTVVAHAPSVTMRAVHRQQQQSQQQQPSVKIVAPDWTRDKASTRGRVPAELQHGSSDLLLASFDGEVHDKGLGAGMVSSSGADNLEAGGRAEGSRLEDMMASFDGDDYAAIAVAAHSKDEQAGMYDGLRRMAEEERPRPGGGWRKKKVAGAGLRQGQAGSRASSGSMRAALRQLRSPVVGKAAGAEEGNSGP